LTFPFLCLYNPTALVCCLLLLLETLTFKYSYFKLSGKYSIYIISENGSDAWFISSDNESFFRL
jgi:hypothetical protein